MTDYSELRDANANAANISRWWNARNGILDRLEACEDAVRLHTTSTGSGYRKEAMGDSLVLELDRATYAVAPSMSAADRRQVVRVAGTLAVQWERRRIAAMIEEVYDQRNAELWRPERRGMLAALDDVLRMLNDEAVTA